MPYRALLCFKITVNCPSRGEKRPPSQLHLWNTLFRQQLPYHADAFLIVTKSTLMQTKYQRGKHFNRSEQLWTASNKQCPVPTFVSSQCQFSWKYLKLVPCKTHILFSRIIPGSVSSSTYICMHTNNLHSVNTWIKKGIQSCPSNPSTDNLQNTRVHSLQLLWFYLILNRREGRYIFSNVVFTSPSAGPLSIV